MLNGNEKLLAELSQLLVEFSEVCKKESQRVTELQANFEELTTKVATSEGKYTEKDIDGLYATHLELASAKASVVAYTHITDRLTAIVTKMMGA